MSETNSEIEVGKRCFGYGRWDAPYWFIGLEEGKGREEPPDNSSRVNAWKKYERDGLCDCKDFHLAIGSSAGIAIPSGYKARGGLSFCF